MRRILIAFALAAAPLHQALADQSTTTGMAPAQEAEIQRTIDAVYASISGPQGEPRDWDGFRSAFTDDARLYAITATGVRGGTPEDYIATSEASLVAFGFSESELTNRIEIYGNLAQVWSSYAGTFVRDGEPGQVRGINSFQLRRVPDGSWRVHSLLWQQENEAFPLPENMARSTD